MANKIIHKHSSVITDGKAKLPTTDQLEYGELAINYAKDGETISFKNSNGEIVEIKPFKYVEDIILKNEYVTASSLVDLDERATALDERITILEDNPIDVSTLASKDDLIEVEEVVASTIAEMDAAITDNELIIASALTELDKRLQEVELNGGGGTAPDIDLSEYAKATHNHGTITLSGDVSGSASITGSNAINITTVVANNSHTHTSANITDSISASSGITSSASGLVQGKAVQAYAAPKTHNHGTINLTGDVTGSATISGTNAVNITAAVTDNSHNHISANISDSINTATNITSSATGLVQGKAIHEMVTAVETKLNGRIDTLVTEIEDDEYVTALAITDLESRVKQLEETVAALQEALADVTAQLANSLTVE
jgi:polyhydroxyalkanoate synthesis regulator phasin